MRYHQKGQIPHGGYYLNRKAQLGRRQITFSNFWIPLRGIFSLDYDSIAPSIVLDTVVEWMYRVGCVFSRATVRDVLHLARKEGLQYRLLSLTKLLDRSL